MELSVRQGQQMRRGFPNAQRRQLAADAEKENCRGEPMWKNPLDHRIDELKTLRKAIQSELKAFKQNDGARKIDEESDIFTALLQIAMEINAVSERAICDAMGVDISTVVRWRKGDSAPPKRKQTIILEILQREADAAEHTLEGKRQAFQDKIDLLEQKRKDQKKAATA